MDDQPAQDSMTAFSYATHKKVPQHAMSAQSQQHFETTYIDAIDHQRRLFSGLRTDLFSQYLERDKKSHHRTSKLVSLNGWGDSLRLITTSSSKLTLSKQAIQKLFRGDDNIERWGGYWLALDGVGIAINPGVHFLERFHEAELHIWDIDHIVITDGDESSSAELERVWSLNKEINALMKDWGLEPHVIHYWLHPKAFERYATKMRPHFRQEMGTLHRLDIFHDDSHPYEKVQLSDSIAMLYVAPHLTSQRKYDIPSLSSSNETPYAIRFEVRHIKSIEHEPTHVQQEEVCSAYLFFLQVSWHESLIPLLHNVKVAVLGVGELSFEEIAKLSIHEKGLGYSGALHCISQLIQLHKEATTAPGCDDTSSNSDMIAPFPLVLFAEYGMKEGDFRIECIKQLKSDIVKKVREKEEKDIAHQASNSHFLTSFLTIPQIIPAEGILTLSLDSPLLLYAPGLDEATFVEDVAVFRSQGPFSRLTYINKSNVLQ